MSDYISRDKVAQAFEDADVDVCEDYGEYYGCEWGFSRDAVRKIVAELPAAAVVEVVHGKWEPGNPICPVCGENKFKDLDADVWADWQPKFCPNCGALMDKEDGHEAD